MEESWQQVLCAHYYILLWTRKLMSSCDYKVKHFLSCVCFHANLCLYRKWTWWNRKHDGVPSWGDPCVTHESEKRNGREWLSCWVVACVSTHEQLKGRAGHVPHRELGTWIETQLCQWLRSFCLPRPPLSVLKSETTGNVNLPSLSSPKPNSSVGNLHSASTDCIILCIASHYSVNSMLNEIKVYEVEHFLGFISILTAVVGMGVMSGVRVDFATFFDYWFCSKVCVFGIIRKSLQRLLPSLPFSTYTLLVF